MDTFFGLLTQALVVQSLRQSCFSSEAEQYGRIVSNAPSACTLMDVKFK